MSGIFNQCVNGRVTKQSTYLRPGNVSGRSGSICFGAIFFPCKLYVMGTWGGLLIIGLICADEAEFCASRSLVNTVIFICWAVVYRRLWSSVRNSSLPVYMKLKHNQHQSSPWEQNPQNIFSWIFHEWHFFLNTWWRNMVQHYCEYYTTCSSTDTQRLNRLV